jgi:HD-like signal output (HDOD) protein
MKTESNKKQSYSYSNQFLRMMRKTLGEATFDGFANSFGPFELASYHPSSRVDISLLSNLLEAASSQNENLGIDIGKSIDIGQFGSASYYALSCSTVYEVLRFYSRFYELIVSAKEPIAVDLTPSYLQVEIQAPFTKLKGDFLRYEMLVATIITMIRQSVGSDCYPEYFEIPTASEQDCVRLEGALDATVAHHDTRIVLRYGRRWLGYRLPNENPSMRQILRADIETQLQQLRSKHSLVEQINIYLEEQLDFSSVTQVNIANVFNMSESTFKRRLQDEGTNFKAILQSFKQTRSLHLLTLDRYKFDSIAMELGFSERASFERAFKTWYGMTPAQFREIARLCQITGPIELLLSQENLPASPHVCQQIVEITSQANYELEDLADVIRTDPVLTGKIIGLSNSAMYGGIAKVSNLQQAIVKLGVEQVKNIAMGILANEAAGGSEKLPIDMRRYWFNALTTAHWARELGVLSSELKQDRETLFLTGLLHNIGFVLLARLRTKDMIELIPMLADHPTLKDKAELEKRVFGVSRYSASAILLAHWGLPVDLITIIHGIIQVIDGQKTKHVASHLVYQIVRYQVSHHTKDAEHEERDAFIKHLADVIKVPEIEIRETVERLEENQHSLEELSAMLISS